MEHAHHARRVLISSIVRERSEGMSLMEHAHHARRVLILSIVLATATVSAAADPPAAAGLAPAPAAPFTPVATRQTGLQGKPVIAWEFDRQDDQNYDDWPDQWKRRFGRSYPRYLPVGLRPHHPAWEALLHRLDAQTLPAWRRLRKLLRTKPGAWALLSPLLARTAPAVEAMLPALPPAATDWLVDRYLEVELDGGAAWIQSEPVPISSMYGYTLSAKVRTEGLQWDRGWAELVYLDAAGEPLQTVKTKQVVDSPHWQRVQTDVSGPPAGCRTLVVRLRVEPIGSRADIRGRVGFDGVTIDRYPQLQLVSDHPHGFYAPTGTPEISATALGLNDREPSLDFVLYDVDGRTLNQQRVAVRIDGDPVQAGVYAGHASWQLSALPAGFYRVVASLQSDDQTTLQADITMVVLEEFPASETPFGWTLPEGRGPFPLNDLPAVLSQCHVGWLKYPCWTAADDTEAAEQVVWLMTHVQDRGIRAVGLLDQPPDAEEKSPPRGTPSPIAPALRNPPDWQPELEPLMSRLTLKVRHWQLGRERDFSFLGDASLTDTIAEIAAGLQGYGPAIKLAISWPWLEPQPPAADVSWETVVRSDAIPLTAAALDAYLAKEAEQEDARGADSQWLLLDPLPRSDYQQEDRIRDLVFRMATVRAHDVEAAFVRDPFDAERGLLRADGLPNAMLLPWRTTSAVLGPLRKLGALQLPGGSENVIFSDGKRTVMMVWSETPRTETLYLGEGVETIDVWGRRSAVPTIEQGRARRQQIAVGRLPQFVVGLDLVVARFRMGVEMADRSVDSLLGRQQTIRLITRNPLPRTLSGDVRLNVQDAWVVSPYPIPWQISPGREVSVPLDISLRTNATTGEEQLQLDFTLYTDQTKRFTVFRPLHVGPLGLHVDVATRMDSQGNLIVRVEMVNQEETPVRYDCRLFPAGRQYQRRFLTIPSGEAVRREFVLPNGEELLGSTVLLRASEEGGRRVLNYTVEASR